MAATENLQPTQSPWETVAQAYHEHLEAGRDPFQDVLNAPVLLRIMPRDSGLSVLDAGCGNARFTARMSTTHPDWHIVGYDGSPTLIRHAVARAIPGARFFVHDVTAPYPNPGEQYDIVVSKMVFPTLMDIRPAVLEAWRLLKNDGLFIISTLHPNYHQKYIERIFQDRVLHFARDLRIEQATDPGVFTEPVVQEITMKVYALLESNRLAIWTRVSDSPFAVPTHLHPYKEIAWIMDRIGFDPMVSAPVVVSEEFARAYPQYKNRVGMCVTHNTMWKKRPLMDAILFQSHRKI